MKSIIVILLSITSYSQVGIGTNNPQSTLDIVGDVRISNVPKLTTTNNVLVVDSNGIVSKVDLNLIKNDNQSGTWIENNTYKFSYSSNTGKPINFDSMIVNFNSLECKY